MIFCHQLFYQLFSVINYVCIAPRSKMWYVSPNANSLFIFELQQELDYEEFRMFSLAAIDQQRQIDEKKRGGSKSNRGGHSSGCILQ